MNVALWVLQILAALLYSGGPKPYAESPVLPWPASRRSLGLAGNRGKEVQRGRGLR